MSNPIFARAAYPDGATPLIRGATGSAAAQVQVTLPALAGKSTYLTKATITSDKVAAAVSGVATITDGTWTLSYEFVETVSAGGALDLDFDPPLKTTVPNTTIVVTLPAITGGGAGAVACVGYQGE